MRENSIAYIVKPDLAERETLSSSGDERHRVLVLSDLRLYREAWYRGSRIILGSC